MLRLIPLALLGACSIGVADVPFPDANELIAQIETRIVLPPGAGPLQSCTRTYSRQDPNRGPARAGVVHGVLERISESPRVARWSEEPAMAPADGGCAAVTLRYSLARSAIEEIRCNGEA
jgi:hypothetical protein